MKNLFVIAEYNPFHNGHFYHIQKAKALTSADYITAVMSGNFVQRGEPAMIDKWSRTEMALLHGVDMVLELPLPYATDSAEGFAFGAVSTANATGICDCICFGSESGDIEDLRAVAEYLSHENTDFKEALRLELSAGLSYPKARSNALSGHLAFDGDLLDTPNNILAIEYIKALQKTASSIIPYTIKRKDAGHHSTEINAIASASAIRKAVGNNELNTIKKSMPADAFAILTREIEKGTAPTDWNRLSPILHYLLITCERSQLRQIRGFTEGLENRLIDTASQVHDIDHILAILKSKRYTYTGLKRALLHLLLGLTDADYEQLQTPPYIRVLGFRKDSAPILRMLEQRATLPVIINLKHMKKKLTFHGISLLQKEIRSTDIYNLSRPDKKNTLDKNQEYRMPVVIV